MLAFLRLQQEVQKMDAMTGEVRFRAPQHLCEALQIEAQRRMLPVSALIRIELGRALGLIEQRPQVETTEETHERQT